MLYRKYYYIILISLINNNYCQIIATINIDKDEKSINIPDKTLVDNPIEASKPSDDDNNSDGNNFEEKDSLNENLDQEDQLKERKDNEPLKKSKALWQQKQVIIPGIILIGGGLGWFANEKFIKDKAEEDGKSSTESNFYELFNKEIDELSADKFTTLLEEIEKKKYTIKEGESSTAVQKIFNEELAALAQKISQIKNDVSNEIEKGKILKDKIYDKQEIITKLNFLNSIKTIEKEEDLNIHLHANHLIMLINSIEYKLGENIKETTKTFFKEIKTQYTFEQIKKMDSSLQETTNHIIEYLTILLNALSLESYQKDINTIISKKCIELIKKHKEIQSFHKDLKTFIHEILKLSNIEQIIKSNTEAIFLNKIDILLQFLNDKDVILKLSEQNACTLIISFIELQEKKLKSKDPILLQEIIRIDTEQIKEAIASNSITSDKIDKYIKKIKAYLEEIKQEKIK